MSAKIQLPPYTRCTHEGPSVALVLPEIGDELLLANAGPLQIYGIAPGHPGRTLRLRAVGGTVEIFPMADVAPATERSARMRVPPTNRVSCKNVREYESVTMVTNEPLDFAYDEKMPGWRQS